MTDLSGPAPPPGRTGRGSWPSAADAAVERVLGGAPACGPPPARRRTDPLCQAQPQPSSRRSRDGAARMMATARPEGPVLRLEPTLANVRRARSFVLDQCHLHHVDGDLCDTAVLLTSEVVTNAFLHGRSEARISLEVDERHVVVMVGDDNSRHPQPVDLDDEALDGRGLAIIELVASRWGVRDDTYGKTVWFELDRD